MNMEYLQLQNNDLLSNINRMRSFKCVLVSEAQVFQEWQKK